MTSHRSSRHAAPHNPLRCLWVFVAFWAWIGACASDQRDASDEVAKSNHDGATRTSDAGALTADGCIETGRPRSRPDSDPSADAGDDASSEMLTRRASDPMTSADA